MKNLRFLIVFFIGCATNLWAFTNHDFITSRVPTIFYNDGSQMGSLRIKEMAAITSQYIQQLMAGSIQPDQELWDKGAHGIAHMRYWFGDHFWHVGLPPDFTSAAHRCKVA
jgi:hypothetical protein